VNRKGRQVDLWTTSRDLELVRERMRFWTTGGQTPHCATSFMIAVMV
jgi:hypothetical protein